MRLFKIFFMAMAGFSVLLTACIKEEQDVPVDVAFEGITANGSPTEFSTKVTLQFDRDIDGLTAEDIVLDAGNTGVQKGALTSLGNGKYELAISGVSSKGNITLSLSKYCYTITPASKTVGVRKPIDLYAAGSISDIDGFVAAVWKNGELLEIETPELSHIYSIAVHDGDWYAVGSSLDMGATMWINGVAEALSIGSTAWHIHIDDNGDTYIAGDYYDRTERTQQALLWKNGVRQELTEPFLQSSSRFVTVVGGNVYSLVRTVDNTIKTTLMLWKNGVLQNLEDEGYGGDLYSIAVHGDDVYVSGFVTGTDFFYPTVWQNGESQYLDDGDYFDANASSLVIADGIVYAAGNISDPFDPVPMLWTNGVGRELASGDQPGKALTMRIYERDSYIGGFVNGNVDSPPVIWKNGVMQYYPTGEMENGQIESIVIVE